MADILMPTEKSHEQHRLVLGGMGGIGKTQLAIAYAKRYNDLYDSIFWLNATSEVSLKASLQSMAECILEADEYEKLEQKQIFLRVRQWLSQPQNTKWLLIFDNYDDPDIFDIQTYCPSVDHGTIILTTRLPDRVGGRQIQLQPFKDVGESLQVLETTSKRADVQDGNDDLTQYLTSTLKYDYRSTSLPSCQKTRWASSRFGYCWVLSVEEQYYL